MRFPNILLSLGIPISVSGGQTNAANTSICARFVAESAQANAALATARGNAVGGTCHCAAVATTIASATGSPAAAVEASLALTGILMRAIAGSPTGDTVEAPARWMQRQRKRVSPAASLSVHRTRPNA